MHIVGKRDVFIDADRNSNELPFVAVTTCSCELCKGGNDSYLPAPGGK